MIYALTKTRSKECFCSDKHCDKIITRNEWAYTSSKKPWCLTHGRMENQYHDVGMLRPAGNC